MEFPMELDYNWPLDFSDQLRPFDGPTFDLLAEAEGSDACEYGLFDGDVSKMDQLMVASPIAWSNDNGGGYGNPNSNLISPLSSSPEVRYDLDAFPLAKLFIASGSEEIEQAATPPISANQELPASPENRFANVLDIWTQASGQNSANIADFPDTGFVTGATGFAIERSASFYRQQAVPEVRELELEETAEEDMLFELDDTDFINDIAIDIDKLASIGPYLPSVSLDDITSLLLPTAPTFDEVPPVIASLSPLSSPCTEMPPQVFYLTAVGSPDAELVYADGAYDVIGSPSSPQNIVPYVVFSAPVSPTVYMNSVEGISVPNSPEVNVSPASSYRLISALNSPTTRPNSPWSVISASSSSASLSPIGVDGGASSKPPVERRLRKKQQNKTAAQRYREKKRGENGTVLSEYEQLECRNTELRAKVNDISKEIAYLKGLIEEICA